MNTAFRGAHHVPNRAPLPQTANHVAIIMDGTGRWPYARSRPHSGDDRADVNQRRRRFGGLLLEEVGYPPPRRSGHRRQ